MNTFDTNTLGTSNSNVKVQMKDQGAKDTRESLWLVPFESLNVVPEFNVREHDEKWHNRVREIADDMKEVGWRKSKPAEVFVHEDGRIIITDAHTRFAAAALARSEGAQIPSVPCIAKEKGTTPEELVIGLHKNNNGEKLSPLGMSIVVKRLVRDHGNTPAQAAKKLGVDPKYAKQMLTLADAPDVLRTLVMEGKASATLVIETIEKHGVEEAVRILLEGLKDAESKGKTKVRAKNTNDEEDSEKLLDKAQKKHAATMYQLIDFLLEADLTPEKEKEIKDRMEVVMVAIEGEAGIVK